MIRGSEKDKKVINCSWMSWTSGKTAEEVLRAHGDLARVTHPLWQITHWNTNGMDRSYNPREF